MNRLVVEKDFYNSLMLLTDLGKTLVNANRASFWYRDERKKQYWTMAASGTERITCPLGKGIVGASIENNETILINNPYEDPRFNPQVDKETGYVTKSILCMPVISTTGVVIGAYQVINKEGEEGDGEGGDEFSGGGDEIWDKIIELEDKHHIEYEERICDTACETRDMKDFPAGHFTNPALHATYETHKIGGYPTFIQDGSEPDDYPFVLQITWDSAADLDIADAGIYYFFYNAEKNDWLVTSDCY